MEEYIALASWIRQISPDPTLPNAVIPFRILFGRKLRTTLDALMSETDAGPDMGGVDTFFVQEQRRGFKEVRVILSERHQQRQAARSMKREYILETVSQLSI